jgi:hypothetical protein
LEINAAEAVDLKIEKIRRYHTEEMKRQSLGWRRVFVVKSTPRPSAAENPRNLIAHHAEARRNRTPSPLAIG